jgi:DNA-binding MarR family transcriptional regulator
MAKIDVTEVWALNYRLVAAVLGEVSPALGELGLEVKELFILAELDSTPYPAALAQVLLIPKPTVSLYVKRLENAGLLKREIDCSDLRRYKLSLTPDGRKKMARGLRLLAAAFGARLGRLSAAQRADFKALLEKLTKTPAPEK